MVFWSSLPTTDTPAPISLRQKYFPLPFFFFHISLIFQHFPPLLHIFPPIESAEISSLYTNLAGAVVDLSGQLAEAVIWKWEDGGPGEGAWLAQQAWQQQQGRQRLGYIPAHPPPPTRQKSLRGEPSYLSLAKKVITPLQRRYIKVHRLSTLSWHIPEKLQKKCENVHYIGPGSQESII